MLRNYYEKATILLLFAKTLAERCPNINKIVSGVQSAFYLFDAPPPAFAQRIPFFFYCGWETFAEPGLMIF